MHYTAFFTALLTVAPLASCHVARSNQKADLLAGKNLVRVSLINPGGFGPPPAAFLTPTINGTSMADIPSFSALIEHESASGRKTKLLFDLGIRKDWRNLPPVAVELISSFGDTIYSLGDPPSQLKKEGINPSAINHVIYSHSHFDHIGDMGLFPKSTGLIVGPGFKENLLPGFPNNPKSLLPQSYFDGRRVREVNFARSSLKIADLPAIDLFDDGSFFLLNAPGHDHGHLAALARVTNGQRGDDDTFILLAGDTSHHCGQFRPTPQIPLPNDAPRRPHLLKIHPEQSPYKPFYQTASSPFNLDPVQMEKTISKLELLDANPNVLTVIAHDRWLLDVVELFPRSANQWKAKGWGDKTRFRFVGDFA